MDKEKLQEAFDTFLDSKVAALSPKVRLGIYAAVFVLLSGLFVYLVFLPKNDEIKALEEQRANLENKLAEVKATAANLPQHKAEMAATEEKLRLASVLLPQRKDIPSLLTNISSLGTNAGLEFLSFTPRAERPMDFYMEVPVAIQVRGPYHNVGSFLFQVSKLDRIVSASDLRMSGPTMENREIILNTSLNLVTYRFKEADTVE
ncbi:MAG: type 4a pilus biogenesis protein PilO [Desulfobacterales bacterium]|nr:type 4a pilus biogenesis protein PilO [Desulfobacterales bacterium]